MARGFVHIDGYGRKWLECSNCRRRGLHPVDWPRIRKKRGQPRHCPRCHAKLRY